MCFSFWISMKRWQTCKSSRRFWFVEANMLFLRASESIKPNAVSSVMWASFREDNAIQRRREAAGARHCALCDRYRFSRRSHFGVEWLFRFVRLTLSGCVIVTWRSAFRPSVRKKCITVTSARRVENCNHVITCPTVRLIGFKVPLGLWFLTAGR